LLVGERGHLALQSGEDPIDYLRTMWNCASVGGLLPEQVWDAPAIPALQLEPGRPSGSAMPLLWSHAEFLKLLVARERGRPVELLSIVEDRYGGERAPIALVLHWRDEVPVTRLEAGRALQIEDRRPFTLHYGFDGWQHPTETEAVQVPFGLWAARLTPALLAPHQTLYFTRRYQNGWEGVDHSVVLAAAPTARALSHLD
jgi:glucoamylase